MKKIFFPILIFLSIIFFLVLIFLSQPQLRHITFTGIVQFPEFATMQAMKGGLLTRDFDRVLPWLNRQVQLTRYYGQEKNKMTPGMLQNIRVAYKFAVLREEREKFIPLLNEAFELIPNNIDINIMLAQSYLYLDREESIKYLNQAKKILPSDHRVYQLANILFKDSAEDIRYEWCKEYQNNQFGDYINHTGSSLLGTGYRRLALEISNGMNRDLYLNEGLSLGENTVYEFLLNGPMPLKNLSIRISNGGAIEVKTNNIKVFKEGKVIRILGEDEFQLFPETGYFVDDKVISTNKQGENIFIKFLDGDEMVADKVSFDLLINKLPIDNTGLCNL